MTSFPKYTTDLTSSSGEHHVPTHTDDNTDVSIVGQNDKSLYFAFGSNIWLEQMRKRCPSSTFIGIARLDGWKWIINARGYANVVHLHDQTHSEQNPKAQFDAEHTVWGFVFIMPKNDEESLDRYEDVPRGYGKETLKVRLWRSSNEDHGPLSDSSPSMKKLPISTAATPEIIDAIVYVDRKNITSNLPKQEYIHRINRAVEDAVQAGIPEDWIEKVVRNYIPADD